MSTRAAIIAEDAIRRRDSLKGPAELSLSFRDNSQKEDGYIVRLGTSEGRHSRRINLPSQGGKGAVVNLPLTNLPANAAVWTTLTAWNAFGESVPVTLLRHTAPPNPPVGLAATSTGENSILISGFDPVPPPVNGGIRVYRRGPDDADYVPYALTASLPWTDENCEETSTEYFYQLSAYNVSDGVFRESPRSPAVSAVTLPESSPPDVTGAALNAASELLVVSFNEPVQVGEAGTGTVTLHTLLHGPLPLFYAGGSGTASLAFTVPQIVAFWEDGLKLDIIPPESEGIMDLVGNAMLPVEGVEVVNSSVQGRVVKQGFDTPQGTNGGYDNNELWSGSVVNPNYKTDPAPLEGAESLLISSNNAGIVMDWTNQPALGNLPPLTELWVEYWMRLEALPSSVSSYGLLRNSADVTQIAMRLQGGQVRLFTNGADSAASSHPWAINTTYRVLLYYKAGGDCVLRAAPIGQPLPQSPAEDGLATGVYLAKKAADGQTVTKLRLSRGTGPGNPMYDHVRASTIIIPA